MSSANPRRDALRAAFGDALRGGDPLRAARAAARLQAHAGELDGRELAAAREVRLGLGRAVREARARRAIRPTLVLAPAAAVIQQDQPRRLAPALAVALLVLLVAVLGSVTRPSAPDDASAGGTPVAAVPAALTPLTTFSRGRVVLALAAVAVSPPPEQQPQATAAPDPVAVLSPAPAAEGPLPAASAAAAGGGRPGGSGAPRPSTGTGGGGAASPTPLASPTPVPQPTPPPPLARGFARLIGQVVDANTGRGVPNACVSLGSCSSVSPRTDANGRWMLDLPVGGGGLDWGLEFAKAGYATLPISVRSRSGYIYLGVQWLR